MARIGVLATAAAALTLLAAAGAATAAPGTRATRGDALAVLQAFPTGGFAALVHSRTATGSPTQGGPGPVAIRPFSGTPFDGAHYCELDWHTILVADLEGGGRSYKRAQAEAAIDMTGVSFTLDGRPLGGVTETAVKRLNDPARFGWDTGYAAQWGRVMTPSDLSVGEHRLALSLTVAGSVSFQDEISFSIDAAGSGTCQ